MLFSLTPTAASAAVQPSPAQLVAQARSNALAAGWTHLVMNGANSKETVTFIQEAGPNRGDQVMRIGKHIRAEVLVQGPMAYLRGNATAITSYFGFPALDGDGLAGQWISIPSSNSEFATVSDDVALASVMHDSIVTGKLSLVGTSTKDGTRVIGIRGRLPEDSRGDVSILWISTGPRPLPVELDQTASEGQTRTVFSAWGRAATLPVPTDVIPISNISSSGSQNTTTTSGSSTL